MIQGESQWGFKSSPGNYVVLTVWKCAVEGQTIPVSILQSTGILCTHVCTDVPVPFVEIVVLRCSFATRRQIIMLDLSHFHGDYREVGREYSLRSGLFEFVWIKVRSKLENMHFRNNSYKFLICNYTALHW